VNVQYLPVQPTG